MYIECNEYIEVKFFKFFLKNKWCFYFLSLKKMKLKEMIYVKEVFIDRDFW